MDMVPIDSTIKLRCMDLQSTVLVVVSVREFGLQMLMYMFKVGKPITSLPRIIGGSDLIVHEKQPRKELEEWFKEAIDVS